MAAQVIGFQGDDPKTDLRGAGMLALLQILHLAARRPQLLRSIFKLSANGSSFPLMTVSINMTQITLTAMRGGGLIKEANRTKTMYDALHNMHAACYFHMYVAVSNSPWCPAHHSLPLTPPNAHLTYTYDCLLCTVEGAQSQHCRLWHAQEGDRDPRTSEAVGSAQESHRLRQSQHRCTIRPLVIPTLYWAI